MPAHNKAVMVGAASDGAPGEDFKRSSTSCTYAQVFRARHPSSRWPQPIGRRHRYRTRTLRGPWILFARRSGNPAPTSSEWASKSNLHL